MAESMANLNKGDLEVYSTTEKQIGVWIDGKAIYKKTWSGITISKAATAGTAVETLVNLGVSIDTLIKDEIIYQHSDGRLWELPYIASIQTGTVSFMAARVYSNSYSANPNKIQILNSNTGWGGTGTSASATLYYTKV